jgi:vacuolar-type H+-ATPase subunit C/Vma6
MKLKSDDMNVDLFEQLYITGGSLKFNFFEKLYEKSINESLIEFNTIFGDIENCEDERCVATIDRRINVHKIKARDVFRTARFGSPFYALKYLFDVEREMSKLRILLKAKYLKMDDKEISELIK